MSAHRGFRIRKGCLIAPVLQQRVLSGTVLWSVSGRAASGESICEAQSCLIVALPHWVWAASLGGLVLLCAIMVLSVQMLSRRSPWQRSTRKWRLFVDALNHVDLCIVIYDKKGRPQFWNQATATTFPALIGPMQNGASLERLISLAYQNGTMPNRLPPDESDAIARGVMERIRAGNPVTRLVTLSDGRIYEALDFRFGQGFYASVRKDVTKLQNQARQIHEQHEELARAYDRMKQFSTIAAHDLSAPLRQQANLLRFLSEDIEETGQTIPSEIAQTIDESLVVLTNMQTLIEDLLNYARLGQQAAISSSVDLSERLSVVLSLIDVPIGFEICAPAFMPSVAVPAAACDAVLRNLIGNSLKHHDRTTGRIEISASEADGMVWLEVRDDGPGIPDAAKKRVFEPFERLQANGPGSGLGLSMVAQMTETWGGLIRISDAPERGSIFQVSMPESHGKSSRSSEEMTAQFTSEGHGGTARSQRQFRNAQHVGPQAP